MFEHCISEDNIYLFFYTFSNVRIYSAIYSLSALCVISSEIFAFYSLKYANLLNRGDKNLQLFYPGENVFLKLFLLFYLLTGKKYLI